MAARDYDTTNIKVEAGRVRCRLRTGAQDYVLWQGWEVI